MVSTTWCSCLEGAPYKNTFWNALIQFLFTHWIVTGKNWLVLKCPLRKFYCEVPPNEPQLLLSLFGSDLNGYRASIRDICAADQHFQIHSLFVAAPDLHLWHSACELSHSCLPRHLKVSRHRLGKRKLAEAA